MFDLAVFGYLLPPLPPIDFMAHIRVEQPGPVHPLLPVPGVVFLFPEHQDFDYLLYSIPWEK